jgi:N-formylglutamate amidohydrolase
MVFSANQALKKAMQNAASAPYLIVAPAGRQTPLVLSSPHSGRHYPQALLARLRVDGDALRALEDGPVDLLLARGCSVDATMIAATYPRALVDLNRDPNELDPEALVDPWAVPGGLRLTLKARAGLGIVPTRLLGDAIYREPLTAAEVEERLACAYAPYHRRLEALLAERWQRFGAALVLDCHSMPTMPSSPRAEAPIDVALGDRFGRCCHPRLTEAAERALAGTGLRVARNRPYAGGHITERYGQPDLGIHALQLELRRGLFMHETSHAPHDGFAWLQALLGDLVQALVEAVLDLAACAAARASRPASRAWAADAAPALRMA